MIPSQGNLKQYNTVILYPCCQSRFYARKMMGLFVPLLLSFDNVVQFMHVQCLGSLSCHDSGFNDTFFSNSLFLSCTLTSPLNRHKILVIPYGLLLIMKHVWFRGKQIACLWASSQWISMATRPYSPWCTTLAWMMILQY